MELNCSRRIFEARGYVRTCEKKAVVERGDSSYCKIHDPEYIKRKHKALQSEWEKEREIHNDTWKREALAREIFEDVTTTDIETNKDKYKSAPKLYEALKDSTIMIKELLNKQPELKETVGGETLDNLIKSNEQALSSAEKGE